MMSLLEPSSINLELCQIVLYRNLIYGQTALLKES